MEIAYRYPSLLTSGCEASSRLVARGKINGQYFDTPEKGAVGIPFFDSVAFYDALWT
jgi:hypothetical protein